MRKYFIIFTICILSIFSCVSGYDISIKASKGYLVVDGRLTDLNERQFIKISRTNPTAQYVTNEFINQLIGQNSSLIPVEGVMATLIVNSSSTNPQEIQFTETSAGIYQLPADFRLKVGNTYQLKFKSSVFDYISNEEKLLAVSSIQNVYDTFNPTGLDNGVNGFIATNDIYIDFNDPIEQNFYQWKWVNWEEQNICASCRQGSYYWYPKLEGKKGDCFPDLSLDPRNYYEYPCFSQTWDIFYSTELNIFSDIYSNGQSQKASKVTSIPLRQSNPCLLNIQQMSLTEGAFRYLKLLKSNVTNTGTLADTPPAVIQGNIHNVANENELVIGYFTASSVFEKSYMVNRRNSKGGKLNNLFTYETSRIPNYDTNPHPQLFQTAIGVEGINRTIVQPKGWNK